MLGTTEQCPCRDLFAPGRARSISVLAYGFLKVAKGLARMGQALTFRFDTIGDRLTASSRLRALNLEPYLAEAGHVVRMNRGDRCDVYVCQKTRPFAVLQSFKAANALCVYDLDDNFLAIGPEGHGLKDEVVAFINAVDVVTVGSRHLLQAVGKYHPSVFVFENAVDVSSTDLVRAKTAELSHIGWFGNPAGIVQLRLVDSSEPITTITRGGDIEFDIATVDKKLTKFDLLLFPVERDEWNLAKNANRMIKSIALGVPILASAVPEHVDAAKRLGLDDRFLISEGELWDAKIADLRRDFGATQDIVLRARDKVLKQFSSHRVGQRWLRHIRQALADRGTGSPPIPEPMSDFGLVTFSYSHIAEADQQPELGGTTFGLVCAVPPLSSQGNFLDAFEEISDAIRGADRGWIVLLPHGFGLTHGFAVEIMEALRSNPDRSLFVVRSQRLGAPPDQWAAYDFDLRGTIYQPRDPGVLVARREWLLQQPWRPADSLSYWTWLLVVSALNEGTLGVVSTPVTWRARSAAIVNICHEYLRWAKFRGQDTGELPDPDIQWLRFSSDVFAALAERSPLAVGASFATLKCGGAVHSDPVARARSSWNIAAALRRLMRGLRRLKRR